MGTSVFSAAPAVLENPPSIEALSHFPAQLPRKFQSRNPDAPQTATGRRRAALTALGGPDAPQTATGRRRAALTALGGPDAPQTATGRRRAALTATGRRRAALTALGGPDAPQTATGRRRAALTALGGPDAPQTATGRPILSKIPTSRPGPGLGGGTPETPFFLSNPSRACARPRVRARIMRPRARFWPLD